MLADSGILKEHEVTHNYTQKYAPQKVVELTAKFWEGVHHRDCLCVESEMVIAALPNGYIDFATTLAQKLGVHSAERAEQMNRYYKGHHLNGI